MSGFDCWIESVEAEAVGMLPPAGPRVDRRREATRIRADVAVRLRAEGRTWREIAAELGITEGGLRAMFRRKR